VKHMKKLIALAMVAVSILAISIPALAASGYVDSSNGAVPGGSVNYYSGYNENTTSNTGLTKIGSLPNGTSITVYAVSDTAHWYRFVIGGQNRYILRQFVNVAGSEWEIAYGTTNLTLGSRGRYVTRLQTDLSNAGYNPGPIDGKYGSATRNAVYSFQSDNGLSYDGIAGPETKAALY